MRTRQIAGTAKEFLKKHKNKILLFSIGFAFAMTVLGIVLIDGRSPGLRAMLLASLLYLIFMLLNNMHVLFLYKDEAEEIVEEYRCLHLYKK